MTYLYVIAAQNATKIGISGEPRQRLRLLQGQTADALSLVDSFKFNSAGVAREIEKRCHHALHEYRLGNSEWFACEPQRCIDLARNLHAAASHESMHGNKDAALALAQTIRTLRLEARLTQAQFGAAIKRNQKWVTAVETAQRPIIGSELPAIARALKVTPLRFWKRFLAILGT